MKRLLIATLLFVVSITAYSQTEYSTNKEGSEYKFEKIAHLEATPVLSQGWTGTCWSFSTLSFFESELKRTGKGEHILSQMWIARFAYIGKAINYIRMNGKANFDEGGAFVDIPWVIKKYGIVPLEAYKGLNYGTEKHTHAELSEVLKGAMEGVLKRMNKLKSGEGLTSAWVKSIDGILNAYLGDVPSNVEEMKFDVDGKEHTPLSYRDELGLNMDDYISVTSFTHHPFYTKNPIMVPDNWTMASSYNVPVDEFWELAKDALKAGYSFAWGSDVSEKYFNYRAGLAIVPKDKKSIFVSGKDNKNFSDGGSDKKASCFEAPGEEEAITQEQRQIGYDNKETTDDHGMHAVGLYKDQKGTEYLLIKNSWGKSNECDGYFYASEAFFKYKTINIFLHKDALTKSMKKKLGVK